jgi:hypothetical protein
MSTCQDIVNAVNALNLTIVQYYSSSGIAQLTETGLTGTALAVDNTGGTADISLAVTLTTGTVNSIIIPAGAWFGGLNFVGVTGFVATPASGYTNTSSSGNYGVILYA